MSVTRNHQCLFRYAVRLVTNISNNVQDPCLGKSGT